jgi:hypothetical protein
MSPGTEMAALIPGAAEAVAAGVREVSSRDPDRRCGSIGCKLARATMRCPLARQWRSEKKLSLPPDTRAITFSPSVWFDAIVA